MIIGIGIDLVDVERFSQKLPALPHLREDLFTPSEIAYCESKSGAPRYYAARYAAKEAFLKALGTGLREGIAWGDIEITRNDMSRPSLELRGKAHDAAQTRQVASIHLSLSHEKNCAIALVILEN